MPLKDEQVTTKGAATKWEEGYDPEQSWHVSAGRYLITRRSIVAGAVVKMPGLDMRSLLYRT